MFSKFVVVVGVGVKYVVGVKLFYDWFGEGGKFVELELVVFRVVICDMCLKNE